MATAILVDLAFFLRRFKRIWPAIDRACAMDVSRKLYDTAVGHLHQTIGGTTVRRDLYRIFVYDCPPLRKKAHWPISKRAIDFAKSPEAVFRDALHEDLRKRRKVALRLGRLSEHAHWVLYPDAQKALLAGKRRLDQLTDDDFHYDIAQKGVDIRIGIDICSLTLKHQVDQIVLVSGDADFVPAAKLARREGIDFVLDPLWSAIGLDLSEHIDGLRSNCPKPRNTSDAVAEAIAKTDLPVAVPEAS